ncbi:MAG: hypothetical protein ACOYND_09375, partial [Bacteroidota bacterium]
MNYWFYIFYIVLFSLQYSQAQNPTFTYQGILTDNDNKVFPDGKYTIVFNLYNTPTTPLSLWSESHQVQTSNGLFNLIIGNKNPITIDANSNYWLGITIDNQAESAPRTQLTYVPFAIYSTISEKTNGFTENASGFIKNINGLDGIIELKSDSTIKIEYDGNKILFKTTPRKTLKVTDSILSLYEDKLHQYISLSINSIDEQFIKDNSITSDKIVDGQVVLRKISSGGALIGQVLKWNGSIWEPSYDLHTDYFAGNGISINQGIISLDNSDSTLLMRNSVAGG